MSYGEIQRELGRLIHNEEWDTYAIPKTLANDRRASGARPRPSSPSSSASGSSANDETGLTHRIPDSHLTV